VTFPDALSQRGGNLPRARLRMPPRRYASRIGMARVGLRLTVLTC
jgi:hypothetical protein